MCKHWALGILSTPSVPACTLLTVDYVHLITWWRKLPIPNSKAAITNILAEECVTCIYELETKDQLRLVRGNSS